jgi:hypothetical protein
MSHGHVPTTRMPVHGAIVVYADGLRPDGHQRLRLAEVVGPTVDDPTSGHMWFGVRLPGSLAPIDFIDLATIVKVTPPG